MDRISRILNRVVKHIAGFLAGSMAILVLLQVLFRYIMEAPLDWSEEMSTFAFTWMCLLGASVGLRYDQHPRLDIFLILFPPLIQKGARVVINISIMFMLVILLIYGVKLTMMMKMQKTAALGYSVSFMYVVLPLSAMIMLLHMIVQTMILFRREVEGP